MFDSQPILKGKQGYLRPLRSEDYDDLYVVASDPLIWEQHPAKNRYQEAEFQKFFRESLASCGALLVIDANSNQTIGSYRFYGYSEEKSEVEIGWIFLARSHWGGATNREVISLMLQHALQFVDRVVYLVGPDNLRSQRAVEKLGGTRLPPRRDASGLESYVYQLVATSD